ncbi:hypothetical protein D3C86_1997490 [compost metagenome]
MPANAQAARNLPPTASLRVIGRVISSSMVPLLRSSAHRRMASAGTRNRYSHGWKLKNDARSAWPRSKKLPR